MVSKGPKKSEVISLENDIVVFGIVEEQVYEKLCKFFHILWLSIKFGHTQGEIQKKNLQKGTLLAFKRE